MGAEPQIPGLIRLARPVFSDGRGTFTKLWSDDDLRGGFDAREVFWSRSRAGVFRGLHVQLPPHDGRKAVFVTEGEVRDFVLDLRLGSPAYGAVVETRLDPAAGALLIPAGCAHGFEVLSDAASMVYLQEAAFDPACDGGVLYSSAGVTLANQSATISERDLRLPALPEFRSPFAMP